MLAKNIDPDTNRSLFRNNLAVGKRWLRRSLQRCVAGTPKTCNTIACASVLDIKPKFMQQTIYTKKYPILLPGGLENNDGTHYKPGSVLPATADSHPRFMRHYAARTRPHSPARHLSQYEATPDPLKP